MLVNIRDDMSPLEVGAWYLFPLCFPPPYYLTRSVLNNGSTRKETLFTKSFRILGRLQEQPFSPFCY